MKALMVRLDEARGHKGEYDDVSYALARAAVEWAYERLAQDDAAQALTDGTWYRVAGADDLGWIKPGIEAVAEVLYHP